uniref:Myb-binding protein 1A n=1 Tax=Lygus hesperus TaxID=30085 RepID=A0A0A9WXH5_LYGHE
MVVPERASHWDYFHLLGSFEDKHKFNYAVKLYLLFVDDGSDEGTREYILSRVVGALGAISNSMRAGAFSLFCTLLVNCPQYCDYESVKKLVDNQLKPTGTMKADAEAYVGQFLAYKAIVQSKLLDKTPSLYKEVANGIMELALKKSYLYPGSLALLGQMSVVTRQEYGSDAFLKNLKDLNNATLDKLQYLLQLEQNIEDPETSVHVFDGRRLLSTETATEIGILLSKCHNASHEFLKQFFEAISDNHKYVSKFWKAYEKQVKDKIGTNKAILDMYYNLLSQALQTMLAKKNFKSIKTLVSDVAIESFIKHNKLKPELTKETCKSISDILALANDSALSLEILNKLVSSSSTFSFDEDTGTKLVGSVWRTLAIDEIKGFGDKCLNAAIKGDGVKNKDRFNALNIYCSLLNQPACLPEDQWRIEGMKALLKAGLLSRENVSAELANAIRKSFFNILSIKFSSLPIYADALKELVACMNRCTSKEGSLRVKETEEMKEAWKISHKMIASLEKHKKRSKDENKIIIQALELLTCFITLKSLFEPKESKFNLTDMNSVLSRVTKSDDGSDDGPEWIEVVMDLFLNMLSKPNVGNRTIINIVFKTVTPHLNEGAFSQLIDVLDPSYDLNKAEDNEEVNEEEDSGEDEETNENTEESEESSDEGDEDSSEESEEDESEDMVDEESNSRAFNQEKLQFDLRNALMPANDSDNESINIDDLDEEQGRQLDAKLSAIFRNAATKKKPSKRESITSHFRTRVVDLLETYCITGMPLEHWLILIPAVLKLANSIVAAKNTAGLKQRLLSFIRKVSSVKISNITSKDCDVNALVELLKQLINQASGASGTELDLKQHYLELIKFGVKNSTHVHPSNTAALKELLSPVMNTAIRNFFSEKNSLQLELLIFLCQYNWCGVHDMISQIIQLTFDAETKPFKRSQGISMLVGYFKSDRIFSILEDSEVIKGNQKSILLGIEGLNSVGLFDQKIQHSVAELIVAMHDSKSSNLAKWKSWKEKLPQLMGVPKGKKFHKHFEAMCKRLGLDKNRFKGSENTGTSAASPGKKGKGEQPTPVENSRKRKQDVRKLKKESKIRRLAAMDGLDFAWSNVAADE